MPTSLPPHKIVDPSPHLPLSFVDPSAKMKEKLNSATMSPCAACKLLRRRCARDCVFAPYFPSDEPQKFANVHKVFGASNVNKMLQDLPVEQRGDAVSSMVYEANARVRDPIYGCVGAISSLQQQVALLKSQLAVAQAEIVQLRLRHHSLSTLLMNRMMLHEASSPDNNISSNSG